MIDTTHRFARWRCWRCLGLARPLPRRTGSSSCSRPPRPQNSGLFDHLLPMFTRQDRHRGPRRRGRHRPGDQERRERRRRRAARPRQAGRGEVRRRGLRRRALRRDVQRLRHRRPARPIRRASRASKDAAAALAADRRQQGALRLARRRLRHPQGRADAVAGGRRRRRPRPPATGTARPARAWARRSTPASAWAPTSLTDRATWISFKNKGDYEIRSRATRSCSTSTASSWSTRRSTRT